MAVRFTILGSGSTGNCAYLETDDVRLLIDAGFSGKQIRERLASIQRTPERLTGILVTHEHSDHTQGLKTIAVKHQIPIYCNRLTKESIEGQFQHPAKFQIFNTGAAFDIGDVRVETFSIPHDAYDPVGFLLHTNGGKLGFLTDLGHATRMIVERIRHANVLVVEANYDRKLLQEDTRRPWSTKQRIMSRHGHLSNDGAANLVQQVATENLKHLYLCHLSQDCNDPDLAHRTISERLEQIDAAHVRVETATQAKPSPTLHMEFGEPTPTPTPEPPTDPETDSDHPQLALF